MDNLPSRLETHVEDIEAGSVMTDSSVNSVLTIPPHRGAHASGPAAVAGEDLVEALGLQHRQRFVQRQGLHRALQRRAVLQLEALAADQLAAAGQDLKSVYRSTMAAVRPKYGHWVIFDHCMPFDVTRCYDELTKFPDPRIWTAERDVEMWRTLEG